jgi:hypothetical protein
MMPMPPRAIQKGQDPKTGEVVTGLRLKSIITQPLPEERLPAGSVVVLGAAYAGEETVEEVGVSVDGGVAWKPAQFIGPKEPFAWRQWQYVWESAGRGEYLLMSRATDARGRLQPMQANWNVLGYGNNGVREHAVRVTIA